MYVIFLSSIIIVTVLIVLHKPKQLSSKNRNDIKKYNDLFPTVNLAYELKENETKIVNELNDAQGISIDINGYYLTDDKLTSQQMRASNTLNAILS